MKTFLLVLVTTLSLTAQAQQKDPWLDYMTPNEVHQLFKTYTGDFDMEITMWPEEGKDPIKVKVASAQQMILGGRFLELRQSGTMMGMDYQSTTTIGYNTVSKAVDLITINNMGTGILSLSGSWNPEIKEAVVSGQMISPGEKKVIKIRQVIHFPNKNTISIENYDQAEGQPARKTVAYTLTRKNN
jgi:hypothetical protein